MYPLNLALSWMKLGSTIIDQGLIKVLAHIERAVRQTLIEVCRGQLATHHSRKITYKELWERHSPGRVWGRGCTHEVVRWIVNVSDHDISANRPPLNSLVVRRDTKQPGANWEMWHKSVENPYKSLDHAQEACWLYWPIKRQG